MVANQPKARIGIIEDIVHEKNANAEVRLVTNISDEAYLKAYESLKIGLSDIAFILKAFFQKS